MAIKGLSLSSIRVYESKLDPAKGTPEATKWQLGTLDSRVMGMIKDMATSFTVNPAAPTDEVETSINRNEVNFQLVSYGLRGWSGFVDDKGNDLPFKKLTRRHGGSTYDVVDPDSIKLIPQAIIEELANEIGKDNEVSEVEGNA
jgi:hypothetical protein